jgi:hypothetical protein
MKMAKIETHEEDCMRLLGAPFTEVHQWLDEYAKKWQPHIHLEYHRKFRHNAEGVKEVERRWGPLYALAAKIHLIRDVELYVLNKEFNKVMGDEIEELYKKCLQYF